MADPTQGEVYDGYRYLGGNPKDEGSWEQVAPVDVSATWGAGARQLPNGSIERVGPRGGVTVIGAAEGASGAGDDVGKLTEAQGKAVLYGGMMAGGERDYQDARASGYNPASLRNQIADFADLLPFDGGAIPRLIRDDISDRGRQAELRFTEGNLRQLSGAAVTPSEVTRTAAINFDRGNDQLSDQRRQTREETYRGTRATAGSGAAAIPDFPAVGGAAGPIGANGLPTYPAITQRVQGVQEIPLPEGGYAPDPNAPVAGDVRVTSQPLTAEEQNNPNVLSAQGYVYDAGTDTWRRSRTEQAPTAESRGWTPESAVAQRNSMNPILRSVDAFGRGFADAASLETVDETAAALDAVFGQGVGDTLGERYRNNVGVQRAIDQSDGSEAGLARNIGEGAGFVASAAVAAPRFLASAGSQLASPLLRGAVTGVRNALGGAALAGTAAAGAETGNALERAQAFLKAAPVGAVVGAVAPTVVNALSRPVVNAAQSVARFGGRQLGRAGEAAGVRGATALRERATPSALTTAVDRFGDRMRSPLSGDRRIEAIDPRVQGLRAEGIDPTLVDGLDDGAQGTIRALASRQTGARDNARQFAEGRTVGLQDRTATQARRVVSPDQRSPVELERDLAELRRVNARTAMEPLEGQLVTLDRGSIEGLRSDLAGPALREAAQNSLASTDEAIRNSGADLNRLADQLLDNPSGVTMTVRQAQDASKAMLDAAEGLRINNPARARALNDLGRGLRDNARTPERGGFSEYGDWLDKYAEDSGLIDAVELGDQFMRMEATEFADAVSRLTPQETVIARAAARRAIEREAGRQGSAATTATTLASGRDQGIRSAALLGEDAPRFQSAMAAERQVLDNARRINPRQGSETALNAQDAAGAAGMDAIRDVATVVRQPITGALSVAARRFQSRGFTDAEAEALVNAAIDPTMTQELISMLSQRMSRREARSLARAVQRSLASGQGSASAQ